MIHALASNGVEIIPTHYSVVSYVVWAICLTAIIYLVVKLFMYAESFYLLIIFLLGLTALYTFAAEETGNDGSIKLTLSSVEEYYGVNFDSNVNSLPDDGDSNEVRIIVRQDDKLTIVTGELMREGNHVTLYKSDYDTQDSQSEWRVKQD